jgi:nucleoside-triphosphatase THEP1
MELHSPAFKQLISDLMASPKTIVIALHRSLVNQYKEKGKLFTLTRENYHEIKKDVLVLL